MCLRCFFFFNDTATTEIYTLSLHDALPISPRPAARSASSAQEGCCTSFWRRSEEHTSELQSLAYLVCRLLLEKKNKLSSTRSPAKLILMQNRVTEIRLRRGQVAVADVLSAR